MKVWVCAIDTEQDGIILSAHATEELATAELVRFCKANWPPTEPEPADDDWVNAYFELDGTGDTAEIQECDVEAAQ